ncbi:hypothetical protein [Polaribacter sp. SA4-12]|uniref:hypothetical protein n=1 Tax=Polaribacter sp. SA4-12 TaxID=1312072 RepID=UPI000B3C0088|nr:hypothetical protein [Polaribacter sp. SA4-12]ARV14841.1 hypothetical protein BTO07_06610 [Polaribacter sp. SA4-12]
MKKITFLCILFLGLSTLGFSQSKKGLKKIEKKATELVEKLNKEILKGDNSLSLSDEQKEKVAKIQVERITAYRKLGKKASKEDKKKLNKSYYSKIFKVLTKEQMKARKNGKKK